MEQKKSEMNLFVEGYKDLILNEISDYGTVGSRVNPLPSIPKPNIMRVLLLMNENLSGKSPLLTLDGGFVIVGPVNGGIHRLLQLLHVCGMPPETKYIFLGNYIGEEEYSLEVATLIISMAVNFPESVFLLKGANETRGSPALAEFLQIVEDTFDKSLANMFVQVFDKLPLAATISNLTLACFGGFGPHTEDLSRVNMCRNPGMDYESIEKDVIFAEPSEDFPGFEGNKFGIKEFAKFSKKNTIFRIIRAQQEKKIKGRVYSFASGKVLSVFHDCSGVIKIANDGSISTKRFDPIVPLKRSDVYFFTINSITTTLSSVIEKSQKNTKLKIRVRLPHASSCVEGKRLSRMGRLL